MLNTVKHKELALANVTAVNVNNNVGCHVNASLNRNLYSAAIFQPKVELTGPREVLLGD